jgi:membrane-associated phospholipid phosphatase
MVTYVLYPALPPWLAAKEFRIPHVEQIIPEMFRHTHMSAVHSLAEKDFANKVAAVPSLHAAFPMLMLLFFWSSGWRARIFFGIYTLAMAFTLVYSAEHFVFDIFAGWAYALGVWFGVSWFWRRQDRRRAEAAAEGHPLRTPERERSEVPV